MLLLATPGGAGGLVAFGSPYEMLIPSPRRTASPRCRWALLRVPQSRVPVKNWRLRHRVAAPHTRLGTALAAEPPRFGF